MSGDEQGPGSSRYDRQLRLPGFGAGQQRRLGSARVAVVGAGGLGSPVLAYLAAAGVGAREGGGWITVVDGDHVDLSNLHRQVIHAESALGEPKALSAARRMRALNSEGDVRPVPRVLTLDDALDLLGGHDLVIDGSDNFPTRYLVSDACEILDVPVVWGSILSFAGQLSVFHADGGRGVTYRDVHPVPPGPGEVPGCAEAGVLGMLCGVVGSAMALEAVKELAGIGESLRGRIALFDALTLRWSEVRVARDPRRPPVRELEDLTVTCGLPGPETRTDASRTDVSRTDASRTDVSRADASRSAVPALVDAEQLPRLRAGGVRLIDIREDHEVGAGMLPGAEHIPAARLIAEASPELEGAVLYCALGRRSAAARTALAARGVHVSSLRGGYAATVTDT